MLAATAILSDPHPERMTRSLLYYRSVCIYLNNSLGPCSVTEFVGQFADAVMSSSTASTEKKKTRKKKAGKRGCVPVSDSAPRGGVRRAEKTVTPVSCSVKVGRKSLFGLGK